MIYNKEEYKIKFYKNSFTQKEPVLDYLRRVDIKIKQKINKYLDFLRSHGGYIDEPYGRHIQGKIRELRVDFSNSHHRLLYFSFVNKNIVMLSIFIKKSNKTPSREIKIAQKRYEGVINNPQLYD
ncbi:MAG: type II toxin-antitoxin system RelE/ParE family toxin [Patescibacteria group bacterium]|nr:type II toxin-antitoxin system RelE/ParE family toxin [Patescibacteria group bacterium]